MFIILEILRFNYDLWCPNYRSVCMPLLRWLSLIYQFIWAVILLSSNKFLSSSSQDRKIVHGLVSYWVPSIKRGVGCLQNCSFCLQDAEKLCARVLAYEREAARTWMLENADLNCSGQGQWILILGTVLAILGNVVISKYDSLVITD